MLKPANHYNNLTPSYIREILKAATTPGMISLAGGLPAEELFPLDALRRASNDAASEVGNFQYGLTEGEPGLRQWIHDRHGLSALDGVLVTTGSQQALDLIARAYLNPGDKVLVEAPCYLGALQVFQLAGVEIITIDQLPDGPDLSQLRDALNTHKPKLFYAVPDFHNPSGVCWSAYKRGQIAGLLNRCQTAFVEDAPYRVLRYDNRDLPYVSELLNGNWFRLGSFSKIISPGLRVGYVCAAAALLRPLTVIKQASDLHSTRLTQITVLSVLQTEVFPEHMEALRIEYRVRRDTLLESMHHQFGNEILCECPSGGMFIWVKFPNYDTDRLAEAALRHNIAVVPSSAFYPPGHCTCSALRLNFSNSTPDILCAGVARLATALADIKPV